MNRSKMLRGEDAKRRNEDEEVDMTDELDIDLAALDEIDEKENSAKRQKTESTPPINADELLADMDEVFHNKFMFKNKENKKNRIYVNC